MSKGKLGQYLAIFLVLSGGAIGAAHGQGVMIERNLSLALAKDIAVAAIQCSEKMGYHVSITVVDRSGETLVLLRGDGSNPHTLENSRRKAYTARTFKMSSGAFADAYFANDHVRVAQASLPGVIPLQGGLPINVGADTIGGIGVSGSPGGGKDEACAKEALDRFADQLK